MTQANIRALVEVSTLLGSIVLGAAVVQAPAHVTPSNFPTVDPQFVECTAFKGNQQDCYTVANEIYQLIVLILDQLEDNDIPTALQELLPTTPQMFPDGTVVYGLEGVGLIGAAWAGSNDFTFGSISADTFRYRPLDHNTVIAYGITNFTIEDHEHGEIRAITSAQTEVFRRNKKLPRGWEQVYEQLAYKQPLLGPR